MARFFDNVTKQPVTAVYISSSRKGYVRVQAGRTPAPAPAQVNLRLQPDSGEYDPKKKGLRFPPRPDVDKGLPERYRVVLYGNGKIKRGTAVDPQNTNDTHWYLSDLTPGTEVVLLDEEQRDEHKKVVQKIPVIYLHDLPSYKEILVRFQRRGLRIDLDSFIDYVYWASPELNEGVYFRPGNAKDFEEAITDTGHFHYDDRRDPVAGLAAFATVGKGYREISSPSLHIAIAPDECSVHIDSFNFILNNPLGRTEIGPNALQHILDELVLRLPMAFLRRKGMTWLAAVMQSIHIILPHSANNYKPKFGIRFELGRSPNQNWMTGIPDIYLESYYDFSTEKFTHEVGVKILTGGPAHRQPDWVLSAKANVTCPNATCSQYQGMVGLFLGSR